MEIIKKILKILGRNDIVIIVTRGNLYTPKIFPTKCKGLQKMEKYQINGRRSVHEEKSDGIVIGGMHGGCIGGMLQGWGRK